MYEQVEKPKKNSFPTKRQESREVTNADDQNECGGDHGFSFVNNRPEAKKNAQLKAIMDNRSAQQQTIQKKENNTGLPDNLKSRIQNLSAYTMDDVKVHYNSDKPTQLQAHAYAQGTDIYLDSGQEKHLPHEAWHVVQQKQGWVKPTMQMKGTVNVNDDVGLEKEADVMGTKAATYQVKSSSETQVGFNELQEGSDTMQWKPEGSNPQLRSSDEVVQRLVGFEFETHWDLKKPGDMNWAPTTTLVRDTGWSMTPDELSGNQAKIEFKTVPFNVDGDDSKALSVPIENAFNRMDYYITNSLLPLSTADYSALPTNVDTAKNVEVKPLGAVSAKPQATGGVRVDLIIDFLRDLAKDDGAVDLMPGEGRKNMMQGSLDYVNPFVDEDKTLSKEFAGVVVLLSYYVRRFQQDKANFIAARDAVKVELLADYEGYETAEDRSEEELEQKKAALVLVYAQRKATLLLRATPSYAKARASALPRVAFNDLPRVTNTYLLKHVLIASGLTEGDGGIRMFPLGFKKNPDYAQTIAEWIAEIQLDRGIEEGELWSGRALDAGDVGSGEKEGHGLPFELRSLPGSLPYKDWFDFAKPFLNYFRVLNKKDKPTG